MATVIAKYKFDTESEWQSTIARIDREIGRPSGMEIYYTSSEYFLSVDDTCEKASLIGQICRASGGSLYNY